MRQQAVSSSQIPKGTIQRAPLPLDQLNPHVKNLDPSKPPLVKFQEIVRDGTATIVGRVKIQTPTGHAFVLRRLDTGAISLTTMFRAAFPTASEETERAEAAWVKNNFDIIGANKSGKARFAGTWVSPDVALEISDSYCLTPVIAPLSEAVPDPNVVYRKSQRPQGATPTSSPAPPKATPKEINPPAAKRRREASPSPAQAITFTPPIPAKRGASPRTPAPATPSTRRSTRLKSPAPPAVVPSTGKSPKTLRPKQIQEDARTSAASEASDITVVESEDIVEVFNVAAPSMEEDVREQKELIARLRAEKEAAEKAKAQAEAEAVKPVQAANEPSELAEVPATTSAKRIREEDSVEFKLNIKEPETEERAVASNSRVRSLKDMPPERKSLAWGALLFAAGMGAVTLFPSLSSFL